MISFIFKSTLLFILFVGGALLFEYHRLPDVSTLRHRNPKVTSLMKLRAGQYRERGLRAVRRQIWIPYRTIPAHLKWAVIVNEDASFFQHNGVDFFELKEAIRDDLEAGRFKRGASTITMQLARNLYLSPRKSIARKIRETLIAFEMERVLSKRRILELYLNVVEWGNGIYGAEAASRHYFKKPAFRLSVSEAATLAALLPNPTRSAPATLKARKNRILKRLRARGRISGTQFHRALHAPLFSSGNGPFDAPAGTDEIRLAGSR